MTHQTIRLPDVLVSLPPLVFRTEITPTLISHLARTGKDMPDERIRKIQTQWEKRMRKKAARGPTLDPYEMKSEPVPGGFKITITTVARFTEAEHE